MEKIRIPQKSNINQVADSDPIKYYYLPLIKKLYLGRLSLALKILPDHVDRMLELGYGCGILLPELAGRSGSLHAMDIHQEFDLVKEMLKKEGSEDINISAMDIRAMGYSSGAFDAVICISVLEHIHDLDSAISEVKRVLKPGGIASIGFPKSGRIMNLLFSAIGFHEIEDHHVSGHKEIVKALEKHFEKVQIYRYPGMIPQPASLYLVCRCEKG